MKEKADAFDRLPPGVQKLGRRESIGTGPVQPDGILLQFLHEQALHPLGREALARCKDGERRMILVSTNNEEARKLWTLLAEDMGEKVEDVRARYVPTVTLKQSKLAHLGRTRQHGVGDPKTGANSPLFYFTLARHATRGLCLAPVEGLPFGECIPIATIKQCLSKVFKPLKKIIETGYLVDLEPKKLANAMMAGKPGDADMRICRYAEGETNFSALPVETDPRATATEGGVESLDTGEMMKSGLSGTPWLVLKRGVLSPLYDSQVCICPFFFGLFFRTGSLTPVNGEESGHKVTMCHTLKYYAKGGGNKGAPSARQDRAKVSDPDCEACRRLARRKPGSSAGIAHTCARSITGGPSTGE
jgi:hypothetical protein